MELRTFHRASRRVVEDRPGAVAGDDPEAVCIFPQLPRRRSRSIVGHVNGRISGNHAITCSANKFVPRMGSTKGQAAGKPRGTKKKNRIETVAYGLRNYNLAGAHECGTR